MSTATQPKPTNNTPAKAESTVLTATPPTISQKFVSKVSKQFEASMGTPLAWTNLQMSLAQNLYIKIDQALTDLEIKRQGNFNKKNDPAITWDNVNMDKLAKDAVARVKMELDAQLPNMIHVIPYLNSRTKKYDIDLRIGYMGADHVSRKFSKATIVDIKYQLVHETDIFKTKIENGVESPYFEQTSPFIPGAVIGGYGYIMYDDPRMNRLYICEAREFEKAKKASKGVEFWGGVQSEWVDGENGKRKKVDGEYDEKFEKEMQFKTLVFRTNKHVKLDTAKINAVGLVSAEQVLDAIEYEMIEETAENANKEQLSLSGDAQAGGAAVQQTGQQQQPAPATQAQGGQQQQTGQQGLEEDPNF